MAEEKKSKIDLKKRLGKASSTHVETSTSGQSGSGGAGSSISVPPPMGPSVVPRGVIPVPPFAGAAATAGASNPFKTRESRRPPPADIKVEVGAEAVEAARASKKLVIGTGIGGALIGIGLGWVFGSGSATSKWERSAISGAGLLAQDVEKANGTIKEFSDKVGGALGDLRAKKFPDAFVTSLGVMNIPFDGKNLENKGIGAYDQATLRLLFQYATDVQALNTQKDALRSLFFSQKKKIIEVLERGDKPQLSFTVLVIKSPKGPVASIASFVDSFALNGDWPKESQMINLVSNEKQSVSRYDSGEIFSSRDRRLGIPLEPESVAAAFPDDVSNRVKNELVKTAKVLGGTADEGPDGDQRPGVIKNGNLLLEALRKIAAK